MSYEFIENYGVIGNMRSIALVGSTVADLAPGKNSYGSGKSPAIELTVDAGNDYYLWLRHAGTSDTRELKPVSIEEGEDRTANIEMLPPRPALNKPHE